MSAYEDLCFQALNELGIASVRQYRIPQVKKRTYDFAFLLDNVGYIIEIDGEQHFKDVKHWKTTQLDQHINDCMKQIVALLFGFRVIRIHYKDIKEVKKHIIDAISTCNHVYYSSNNYAWMNHVYLMNIQTQKGTIRKNYIKKYVKKRFVFDAMNLIPSMLHIFMGM